MQVEGFGIWNNHKSDHNNEKFSFCLFSLLKRPVFYIVTAMANLLVTFHPSSQSFCLFVYILWFLLVISMFFTDFLFQDATKLPEQDLKSSSSRKRKLETGSEPCDMVKEICSLISIVSSHNLKFSSLFDPSNPANRLRETLFGHIKYILLVHRVNPV